MHLDPGCILILIDPRLSSMSLDDPRCILVASLLHPHCILVETDEQATDWDARDEDTTDEDTTDEDAMDEDATDAG